MKKDAVCLFSTHQKCQHIFCLLTSAHVLSYLEFLSPGPLGSIYTAASLSGFHLAQTLFKRLSMLDLPIAGLSSFYSHAMKCQWENPPQIPDFFLFSSYFLWNSALFITFSSLFFANLAVCGKIKNDSSKWISMEIPPTE